MKRWVYGLIVAFLAGSLNALELARIDPEHFSFFSGDGWEKALDLFIVNGLVSVRLYMMKAPAPGSEAGANNDVGL